MSHANVRTRPLRRLLTAALLLGATVGLAACEEEGPAEQLGEKVDEAVQDTKRAIEDAKD